MKFRITMTILLLLVLALLYTGATQDPDLNAAPTAAPEPSGPSMQGFGK